MKRKLKPKKGKHKVSQEKHDKKEEPKKTESPKPAPEKKQEEETAPPIAVAGKPGGGPASEPGMG